MGTMSAADLFSIAGKTALVTGGTRGIGRMIAEGFVEAGAAVTISSRKADACAEVAAELSAKGTCIGIPADLSTEAGCRRLAEEMASRVDRLDILVNNAGATWGTPLAEFDEPRVREGARPQRQGRLPPHQVPGPAPRGRGHRSTSRPGSSTSAPSTASRVPVLETYAYSASKAAVHQLTRHLAKRLAPTVTVNAIAPGRSRPR